MEFRQHSFKSPLRVKFKLSDEHSLPFHMGNSKCLTGSEGVMEWIRPTTTTWRIIYIFQVKHECEAEWITCIFYCFHLLHILTTWWQVLWSEHKAIVIRNFHAPANLAGKSHCDTGVGIEISYFCYKNIKNRNISAKMSINVFPHTKHLHMLKGESRILRNETRLWKITKWQLHPIHFLWASKVQNH